MKLKNKMIFLVISILFITLIIVTYFFMDYSKLILKDEKGKAVLNMATSVATMEVVVNNVGLERGIYKIQPKIETLRLKTKGQFIIVMDMDGIAYSHYLPEKLGKTFVSDKENIVLSKGRSYITTETIENIDKSIKAFTPIYRDGKQVGAVCVGLFLGSFNDEYIDLMLKFLPYIIIGFAIGILGAIAISNNIKKSIFGLEPDEIAFVVNEREAILESMNEGIIAANKQGVITLVNKNARKFLNEEGYLGRDINEIKEFGKLKIVLRMGIPITNVEEKLFTGKTIISNYYPITNNEDNIIGALVTFHDFTKVKLMAEELTGIKRFMWSLRAQNHEFMNKLHTISGLIQLEEYDKALEFIHTTGEIRTNILELLNNKIKEPVTAGLILAKYNKAVEGRIDFKINENCKLNKIPDNISKDEFLIILGNLIENSIDAVIERENAEISMSIIENEDSVQIEISNNGNKIPRELEEKIFKQGFTTKHGDRGHGLYNIVKILKEIDGQMWFTTGEKTTWYVTIPK